MQDISSIKNIHLLDLKPENEEFENFISEFQKREKVATTFIPTSEFIRQEIDDFKKRASSPFSVVYHISASESVRPFSHSICATKVFENLTKGYNVTVGQIIQQAKTECEESNKYIIEKFGRPVVGVSTDGHFEEICFTWIKTGIAFTLYVKFLFKRMEDHSLTFEKFKSIAIVNSGNDVIINVGNDVRINKNVIPDEGKEYNSL